MKFVDYESSHITPQMTLLKKFNEVLKYLRTGKSKLFLHKIKVDSNAYNDMYLICNREEAFTSVSDLYSYLYDNNLLQFFYDTNVSYTSIGSPLALSIRFRFLTSEYISIKVFTIASTNSISSYNFTSILSDTITSFDLGEI